MRPHPKSVIRVYKQPKGLWWAVAEQLTTPRGLSRNLRYVHSEIPELKKAKLIKKAFIAGAIALSAVTGVKAAPPPNADPVLAPYFQSLTAPDGTGCCGPSDCRILLDGRYRQTSDGTWWAFIGKREFGETAPDEWRQVPEKLVNPRPDKNPTDGAVVCWNLYLEVNRGFYCFRKPSLGD